MPTSLKSNPNSTNNDNIDNDLKDILDIIQLTLLHSWRFILSLSLLFALGGFILALLMPKQWEATATLHIGRIPANLGVESKLIEDPLQTVERIKSLGFQQKVLTDLGLPIEKGEDQRSDILLGSLKGISIQNTEFLNLSVRGYSKNDAINSLKIVTKEIQAIHLVITQPFRNYTQKESLIIAKNLNDTSLEVVGLKSKMSNINKPNASFAPSIVAINLLAAKEGERNSLQNQLIQKNAQLTAFDEQATTLVNKIYVSSKPVFPKRSTFIVIGALLGLLSGAWLALFRYKKACSKTG